MNPLESSEVAKPTEISSEELRRNVGDTLKRVGYAGEQFIVTIHGKPVAKIVPLSDDDEPRKAKPKN